MADFVLLLQVILFANVWETREVDTHVVLAIGCGSDHVVEYLLLPSNMLRITLEGVLLVLQRVSGCQGNIYQTGYTHIFEAVEILVAFAASLALEWLFLFHSHSTRIRGASLWVYDGKGTVSVLMQPLGGVPV